MTPKPRARNRSRKQQKAFLSDLEQRVRGGEMSADEAVGIAQGMRDFEVGRMKSIEQVRLEMNRKDR